MSRRYALIPVLREKYKKCRMYGFRNLRAPFRLAFSVILATKLDTDIIFYHSLYIHATLATRSNPLPPSVGLAQTRPN